MQIVNPQLVSGKKVILRYDIDVALGRTTDYRLPTTVEDRRQKTEDIIVLEDFKLKAGLSTLRLCLDNASQVVMIGHVGRPEGKEVPELRVEPIRQWFAQANYQQNGKFTILENLRFDPRESFDTAQDREAVMEYAKELAGLGDVFIFEAFSAYRPASSTTILPTLLPHAAGLRFVDEVETFLSVRDNPKKPFIAVMGGAKVKDKLPVIEVLAKKADAILVGGKLVSEIREQNIQLPKNVMVGKLNEDGFDIAAETTDSWKDLIAKAAQIVWNGPLGKFEDPKYDQTKKIAEMILDSAAEVVIGGGDSVAALGQYGLLEKAQSKSFVSVGGGAMLKLLADGTLPTIQALA